MLVSNVLEQTEMDCLNRYFGDEFRSLLESDLKIDSSVYIGIQSGTTGRFWRDKGYFKRFKIRKQNYSTAKSPWFKQSDWALYEIFKTSEYNDL